VIAKLRVWSLAIGLIVVTTGTDHKAPDLDRLPRLVNTCLNTKDVKRLEEFYEPVLVIKAKRSGEDYAEFATGVGVLAIFSAKAQEKYIPGSSEAATNKSVILEFSVADVDQEYRRLQSFVKNLGQATHDTAMGNSVHLFP